MLRLHSKTIMKLNSALVIFIVLSSFVAVLNLATINNTYNHVANVTLVNPDIDPKPGPQPNGKLFIFPCLMISFLRYKHQPLPAGGGGCGHLQDILGQPGALLPPLPGVEPPCSCGSCICSKDTGEMRIVYKTKSNFNFRPSTSVSSSVSWSRTPSCWTGSYRPPTQTRWPPAL